MATDTEAKKRKLSPELPQDNDEDDLVPLSEITKRFEEKLGFRLRTLKEKHIEELLIGEPKPAGLDEAKEAVYQGVRRFLKISGSILDDNPSTTRHLIYSILSPILDEYIERSGRKEIQLQCDKTICSVGSDHEDRLVTKPHFVVVDLSDPMKETIILIMEKQRNSWVDSMKHCLMAMRNAHASNGFTGLVYGFVTSGEHWRMFIYDGTTFAKSGEMKAFFEAMESQKHRWMTCCSLIVDCLYLALRKGGGAS
ncbi:hypothetical protein DFH27DRAFT_533361 [Peziza echinospora]|nr:hypothetical protein DFH27DRAFT_533361 [Peziza echinospora]